jgi:hypothetical protein
MNPGDWVDIRSKVVKTQKMVVVVARHDYVKFFSFDTLYHCATIIFTFLIPV